MRRFLASMIALGALPLGVPAARAQGATKIGFVDLEYALNNVEEGKKAKAVLDQELKAAKGELEALGANVDRLEDELTSQSLVLSDEARRKKEAELAALRAKYEESRRKLAESWQKKEANLTRDLLDRITLVISEVGREGGYTFILERHDASVLYAQENVDLTRQVIDRFNKRGGR